MVQFGTRLKTSRFEPWENEYLDYKRLKNILSSIQKQIEDAANPNNNHASRVVANGTDVNGNDFVIENKNETVNNNVSNYEFRMALHEEIEKVVLFFLETQGDIAKQMKLVRSQQIEATQKVKQLHFQSQNLAGNANDTTSTRTQQQNGDTTGVTNEDMDDCWVAGSLAQLESLATRYRDLGETLVELVHYVELNATAVRKILKKHDKNLCGIKHYYERNKSKSTPKHKKRASLGGGLLNAMGSPGGGTVSAGSHQHPQRSSNNNATTIPNIHVKRLSKQYWTLAYHGATDSHLQQLYHYDGIAALVTTLRNALLECVVLQWALESQYPAAATKDNASTAGASSHSKQYDSIQKYLSKKHGSSTTSASSTDDDSGDAPEVDTAALMGLVTHSLSLVPTSSVTGAGMGMDGEGGEGVPRRNQQDFMQDDDDDTREQVIWWMEEKEPILGQLESARRKLHKSTNFLQAVAGHSDLMLPPEEEDDDEEDDATVTTDTELDSIGKEEARLKRRRHRTKAHHPVKTKKASQLSSFLNLMSTFLYMTNYYIIAPTSGSYAAQLGASRTLSGLIIGMTPIAACVSAVLYSWWANYSYKSALLFASTCSVLGNICYAMGLPLDSFSMVIVGRLLNGFGGARAINRRYIADNFHRHERTAASAAFVTAGALGMSAGPAMAAMLGYLIDGQKEETADQMVANAYEARGLLSEEDPISAGGGILSYITVETSPGWVMGTLWTIYLITAAIFFEEPQKLAFASASKKPNKKKTVELAVHSSSNGEMQPLTSGGINEDKTFATKIQKKKKPKKKKSLLQNIPVMTSLAIYFVLKFVIEALLSSAEPITGKYFDWNLSQTGTFLAVLGLLMFPANILVAHLSHTYEDRDVIVSSLIVMTVGCLGLLYFPSLMPFLHIHTFQSTYSAIQYVVFGMCVFISCNALESVNMALLSKTIPTSWARGTFNSGLLATEAGTMGRAAGDLFISAVAGTLGFEWLLDGLFVPCAVGSAIMAVIAIHLYPHLEPNDDDDDD
jgi:MFS family permease